MRSCSLQSCMFHHDSMAVDWTAEHHNLLAMHTRLAAHSHPLPSPARDTPKFPCALFLLSSFFSYPWHGPPLVLICALILPGVARGSFASHLIALASSSLYCNNLPDAVLCTPAFVSYVFFAPFNLPSSPWNLLNPFSLPLTATRSSFSSSPPHF